MRDRACSICCEDMGAVLVKKGQTLTQIQQARVGWWGHGWCRGGKRVLLRVI